MTRLTRRRFLEDSMLAAAAAAAVSPSPLFAEEVKPVGPNDALQVAIIGCGIRGKQHAYHLNGVPGCEIASVCDADEDRAGQLAAIVGRQQARTPQSVQDLRRVLDDDAVDAVFIAAPDHWHALAAVWAMEAGKDVYVEKPVSHNISEGRRIVQTARRLNRICQTGTQNRSHSAYAAAIEYIHDGKLGDVRFARSTGGYNRRKSIGGPGVYEVPASVDYNLFCGPAPMSPLTRPTFHYDWHWFWETGTGNLGNINVHSLDVCRWGLGLSDLNCTVRSYGGRLGYIDAGQTPNTQVVSFDFGDKSIISETRGLETKPYLPDFDCEWIFEGTNGFIANASLFDLDGKLVRTFNGRQENHFANFISAVRSRRREDLNADILEGHLSTTLCHLGNISWRLGRPVSLDDLQAEFAGRDRDLETLESTAQHLSDNHVDLGQTKVSLGPMLQFDAENEIFVSEPRADALLSRDYRQPFVLPDAV